ncbi:MAG: hypothetical protein KatS3mg058_2910 [Roseiflexus sp.]|jgi:hypothetical protein|nr:MAG: hypothetical protein KatS3mg058_2910 [Roseiflexus sp.]
MPERDVRLFLLDMLESMMASTRSHLLPMTWRSML